VLDIDIDMVLVGLPGPLRIGSPVLAIDHDGVVHGISLLSFDPQSDPASAKKNYFSMLIFSIEEVKYVHRGPQRIKKEPGSGPLPGSLSRRYLGF